MWPTILAGVCIFVFLYLWVGARNTFIRLIEEVEATERQIRDASALSDADREYLKNVEQQNFEYHGRLINQQDRNLRRLMMIKERRDYIEKIAKPPMPVPPPFPSIDSITGTAFNPVQGAAMPIIQSAAEDLRNYYYQLNANIAEYNKAVRQFPQSIVAEVHDFVEL